MPARPVAALAELTDGQDAALRNADYDTMTQQMPSLLGELQVHAAIAVGADRDLALRLLIQACALAMIMLRHFGLTDLAWVSADRGRRAADLLGHRVWRAAAAFECAHARTAANKSQALLSTPHRADELQPHVGDDRFAAEVYGMLHLSAALACAVRGDHSGACAHGAEAAEVAGWLGDWPDSFELFGPSNVAVWRASFAVEAGNAEEALSYADAVEPRHLASGNRRAALRLEKARAYAMLGQDADAVREIRQAERLSPAQTHHHPMIRELVTDMLARARREAGGRDLREFPDWEARQGGAAELTWLVGTRRASRKPSRVSSVVILALGTYWAQRAADDGVVPPTAAHPRGIQDHGIQGFPQARGLYLRLQRVGRLGLEPRTGGL